MIEHLLDLRVFDCITFIQSTHSYLINNKMAPISVTGLLGKYKEAFEVDKWSTIKANKLGITPGQMKEEWHLNNLYATHRGTIVHNFIENYFNNKIIQYNKESIEKDLGEETHEKLRKEVLKLIDQFKEFSKDIDYILPVKQEFVVGDIKGTQICGMVDLVAYNTKTNKFEIYDYKTNKEIKFNSKFKKNLLPPIDHLEDCEFNSYSLQLNIYKYFIEKYTSIKIDSLNIVWFNVNNDSYKLIPLLDMQKEVELILKDFIK